MARIYRRSDRITLKIGELVVQIAPLSIHQKTEIQNLMLQGRLAKDVKLLTEGTIKSVKYAVKSVKGLEGVDGKPYELGFDSEGNLTDDSIDDLLNIEDSQPLALACMNLLRGIPTEFTDEQGRKLEGVEFVSPPSPETDEKNV